MKRALWSLFEVVQTVAIAVVAVFLVRTFVAQPFLVSGASMEPTFENGDYLLVDELAYRFREPERGEVIVFRYPGDHRSYYIKRIIGLPGERVEIKDGQVEVLGRGGEKVLREPYVAPLARTGNFDVTLGDGEYFMMGDNRNFSFDSRNWGPLARGDVIGLVRLRLWPLTSAQAFAAPAYQ
ncbi:MAG: signal peptidase I [Candidatus Jorgensenbacteria bacterium]